MKFYKYQGTGNDFILIDNRKLRFNNDTKNIKQLCNRKFGIGADGLILLQEPKTLGDDFEMVYYNADGTSSMCGNGGRCVVMFAKHLKIVQKDATFTAIDGQHYAKIYEGEVSLKMQNVSAVKELDKAYFVNTGSPHHIVFTKNLEALDVKAEGASIRNNSIYKEKGVNVNFVEEEGDCFFVRTFERGVEDETLSCGTGVTAVAMAAYEAGKTSQKEVAIKTRGGELSVSFEKNDHGFTNIWLTGPAKQVFKGEIE